jgi:hypothetical protein
MLCALRLQMWEYKVLGAFRSAEREWESCSLW